MSSTELAIRTQNVDEMARIAKMLVVSGYFETNHDQAIAVAQMATKILAGAELGFGPWASVTGIHVIQGKPVLGANLMAAAVKASARYDYRVRQADDKGVSIEFFQREDGKLASLGVSSFTAADAAAAGLTGKATWKQFFRNMAFARAMSNGVRWYCPDVFAGAVVYSGDELGPIDDGGIPESMPVAQPVPQIEAPAIDPLPEVEFQQPAKATIDALRVNMHELGQTLYGKDWDAKRHELAGRISEGRTQSSKELTDAEIKRMNAGMAAKLATRDAKKGIAVPAGVA